MILMGDSEEEFGSNKILLRCDTKLRPGDLLFILHKAVPIYFSFAKSIYLIATEWRLMLTSFLLSLSSSIMIFLKRQNNPSKAEYLLTKEKSLWDDFSPIFIHDYFSDRFFSLTDWEEVFEGNMLKIFASSLLVKSSEIKIFITGENKRIKKKVSYGKKDSPESRIVFCKQPFL